MIDFIIKTLDSTNHHFSVDDETTVEQLKEKIRERLGLEVQLQRLIFLGRVLQDDKKLMDIDVNGKVLHLVQRPPPSPTSRQHRPQPTNTTPANNFEGDRSAVEMQQHIRRLLDLTGTDYMLEHQQQIGLSPTAGRLELIRRTIIDIKTSLIRLAANLNNEPEPNIDENGDIIPENESRAQNSRRRGYRAMRALRTRHTRPRDLAQLLDDLNGLQEQFTPFRVNYVRMLRASNAVEAMTLTEGQREHEQRFVDLVSDVMHSFAHAYHAAADVNFQVGIRNSRLISEPVSPRHPMQAHINVVQSQRRPANQQQSANANPPASNTGSASATVTSGDAPANTNMDNGETANTATIPTPNAGLNLPNPITYQVEIEARVPIAVPIDNVMLSEVANMAAASMHQQHDQNLAQHQENHIEQGHEDFENILRGLNQGGWFPDAALGGVEVLMSMEEMPQGISDNNPGQQNIAGEEAYIDPLPWDGPPGVDLLQNFVASLVRQGFASRVEGVALHVTGQAQDPPRAQQAGQTAGQNAGQTASQTAGQNATETAGQTATQTAGQTETQTAGQTATQTAGQTETQTAGQTATQTAGQTATQTAGQTATQTATQTAGQTATQTAGQTATQTAGQTATQTAGQTAGQNQSQARQQQHTNAQANRAHSQARRQEFNLRRAAVPTRTQIVSINNGLYDRFLQCNSLHARRHAQRRRNHHQQQVIALERLRSMRTASQNIEALRERVPNITHDHMLTMINLIHNSPQSPAVWLNSFLVAVARHLFLADALSSVGSEPPLMPHEFTNLRNSIRNYVQNLITRSERTDGENAFQGVADFLVDEHVEFINNMGNITMLMPGVDILESIRALVRSRLPAVIATVMSDASSEVAASRFYGVISRVFMDICTLIALVCPESADGLRAIYTFFMEQLVQDYDEAARRLLITLSMENLNGVVNDLRSHMDAVRQFIRYSDDFFDTMLMYPEQEESMEVLPSPLLVDEPMQSTPPASRCPIHGSNPIVSSPAETLNDDDSVNDNRENASTSSVKSAEAEPAEQPGGPSTPNRSPEKSTVNNAKPETPNKERSAPDSPSNIQIVTPLMIMQHWSEEWVPVISNDQQAQNADPQEPYSDAYLSGMPAKKRRCLHQTRPPTTLDGFMNESAREAVSCTSPVEDNSVLRSAFREHMRNLARDRSTESEDYDPLRYASAARFIGSPIVESHSSETNDEKNDN